MLKLLRSWWEDQLLRGVLKNSSYLFSSNTVAAGLSFLQGILATRLLGVDGYGLVSGTIIVFVSNIHSLLSFRMSETVVRFTASALKDGLQDQAAGQRKLHSARVRAVAAARPAGRSLPGYGRAGRQRLVQRNDRRPSQGGNKTRLTEPPLGICDVLLTPSPPRLSKAVRQSSTSIM